MFVNTSSSFEQEHVLTPGKSFPPLSAAGSTVFCSASFFLKDQTGDNLMVQGQACRVNAAALSVHKL